MHWRVAQRRRDLDRKVEAHLGDVCGEPFPPIMAPYHWAQHEIDGIERLKRGFLCAVAVLIYGLLILGLVAALFLFPAKPSLAHGNPAEWIQRGGYKNAAGELCCGIVDCGFKIGGTIEQTPAGYRVNATFRITTAAGVVIDEQVREFVPMADATPSPDGSYWRCRWGGGRKCFFYPMPNT